MEAYVKHDKTHEQTTLSDYLSPRRGGAEIAEKILKFLVLDLISILPHTINKDAARPYTIFLSRRS